MKKISLFFMIAFIFNIIGHLLWSASLVCEAPFFINKYFELLINIPYGLFAIFGLIASYKFYHSNK